MKASGLLDFAAIIVRDLPHSFALVLCHLSTFLSASKQGNSNIAVWQRREREFDCANALDQVLKGLSIGHHGCSY